MADNYNARADAPNAHTPAPHFWGRKASTSSDGPTVNPPHIIAGQNGGDDASTGNGPQGWGGYAHGHLPGRATDHGGYYQARYSTQTPIGQKIPDSGTWGSSNPNGMDHVPYANVGTPDFQNTQEFRDNQAYVADAIENYRKQQSSSGGSSSGGSSGSGDTSTPPPPSSDTTDTPKSTNLDTNSHFNWLKNGRS